MKKWGNRLSYAMQLRGMRKSLALAVTVDVDESTISRWRNSGPISVTNAIMLAAALDVSLDWLLLGRGSPHVRSGGHATSELEQIVHSVSSLPDNVIAALVALLDSFSEL